MKKRPVAVWFFSIYILLFSLGGILGGVIKGSLGKEVLIACLVGIGLAIWLFKPSMVALRIVQAFLASFCIILIIAFVAISSKEGVNFQSIVRLIVFVSFFGIPLIYSLRDKIQEQFK